MNIPIALDERIANPRLETRRAYLQKALQHEIRRDLHCSFSKRYSFFSSFLYNMLLLQQNDDYINLYDSSGKFSMAIFLRIQNFMPISANLFQLGSNNAAV